MFNKIGGSHYPRVMALKRSFYRFVVPLITLQHPNRCYLIQYPCSLSVRMLTGNYHYQLEYSVEFIFLYFSLSKIDPPKERQQTSSRYC